MLAAVSAAAAAATAAAPPRWQRGLACLKFMATVLSAAAVQHQLHHSAGRKDGSVEVKALLTFSINTKQKGEAIQKRKKKNLNLLQTPYLLLLSSIEQVFSEHIRFNLLPLGRLIHNSVVYKAGTMN